MNEKQGRCFTRREALRLAGAAALPLFAGAYEGKSHIDHVFDRTQYQEIMVDGMGTRYLHTEVGVPNLPPDADGLTVVHLTDIHADRVGRTRMDPERLGYVVECINTCTRLVGLTDEDIIFGLGGDVVNQDTFHDGEIEYGTDLRTFEQCLDALGRIRAGKRVACAGNHESSNQFCNQFRCMLIERGFSHLGDVAFEDSFRGVKIVGIRDFTTDQREGGRFYGQENADNLSRMLSGPDPTIVFSHTPSAFDPLCTHHTSQNIHGFAGHLHGLYAPEAGILQRAIRLNAISHLRKSGLVGSLFESQVIPAGLGMLPNTIEITNGIGNHPRYARHPRLSACSVVLVRFKCSDALRIPNYTR